MIRLVYFKNDTCSVCKALLPKIINTVTDYSLRFDMVDITEQPALAGQNLVFTVPTLIIFDKDGKEIKRFVRNFSELEVRECVERIVKSMP